MACPNYIGGPVQIINFGPFICLKYMNLYKIKPENDFKNN